MLIYTNLGIFSRIMISLCIGLIVGIIGVIVRLGWEVLFPVFLDLDSIKTDSLAHVIMNFLNLSPEVLSMTYVFESGYEWNVFYILWQFAFSLFFAVLYVMIVEFWMRLKFAQGIFYGIFIWAVIYVGLLPSFGFIYNFYSGEFNKNSVIYLFNTLLESILWIWIIELTRRDLRNRFTQERDPL